MTQEMKEKKNEEIELNEEQMEAVAGGAHHMDWWNVGHRHEKFAKPEKDSEEQQG